MAEKRWFKRLLEVDQLVEMMENVYDMGPEKEGFEDDSLYSELRDDFVQDSMAQIAYSALKSNMASKEDVEKACEVMGIEPPSTYWRVKA